ncbi:MULTISPECIES: MarR family transcriptional regulator [unclassified Beijerinckia]|uniref:MarR family winged helix-turn-helix transcriptional regulator n=1 Tax=unclassified Beijerinckia TaxID=2638183 RepID=UPI000894B76A|nr:MULTISPECIES: MarR family transcriptional regulator [unclassified Beijerinckia]MDH7798936.1 DNA-binding MarR family transcriptional regulator [Beijerinckia sp. GAS462]SED86514.1 DNA-binding transcriptional regulator, MarR family [Beijerinckia sp. 28-YEA-48]
MSAPRTSFPAADLIAPHVNTLSKYLTRAAVNQARSNFELGQVEWQVVTLLGVFQPISIRELTFHALLDAAQVSRAVAALAKRGLVSRRQSPEDRREAKLTLTAAGRSLHADLTVAAVERNNTLLEGFSAKETRALIEKLDILIERAKVLADESKG